MTRPFGLWDLGLLWGLRGQGITLDMQRVVLAGPSPLGAALTGLLPPRHSSTLTYVCRCGEPNGNGATRAFPHAFPGFVQVLTCPQRHEWQVIHLAPWPESQDLASGAAWVGVLSDICTLAGQWGALRVRAGVAAGGPEEEMFRQAGFAAYAREEIYRLEDPRPVGGAQHDLRPVALRDAWPLAHLMDQVVPSTVQHAEGTTLSGAGAPMLARLGVMREQGYVLELGTELGAYLGLSRGRQGAWARILLHPDARRQAADVVRQAISMVPPAPALFFAVREYQAGLRSSLTAMGFEFVGVQVWLVKHTTRPTVCLRYRHVAVLEKRAEPVTNPLHPANDAERAPCSRMAREHWMYEYRRADSLAISSD